MSDDRTSWEQYFMDIAQAVSGRSTCPKRNVGAILVRDRIILSTGYNGSIRGGRHCEDVGCLLDLQGKCRRTIHAETNAVIQAARNGVAIDGAICIVTRCPCWECYKMLANAGIIRVIYLDGARPWVEVDSWKPTTDCEAPGMELFQWGENGARCW